MLPSSLTKFIFIPFLLLIHAFVPALSIPVQRRPSLAKSLDATAYLESDTTLPKRPHIIRADTRLFKRSLQPPSNPIDHNPYPTSRLFAHTYPDPHESGHSRSLSLPHVETPADHRVVPSLGRRWWVFDKIKQGFQNFGKKVKEGFQNAGKKIKEGFQNFGKKVKGAFQTAGSKIKEGFQKVGQKIKQGFQKVKGAFETAGKKIKEGFQTAGKKIKEGFQTAGKKIKQGFQKVKEGFQTAGRKIKEGFQTAGKKMKEGFIKAGNWIKENGAKVAKFGLKVWSTVQSVAAKAVKYVLPGIGKPISAALDAESNIVSKLADKIPAKLGDKLDKGMQIMDKIQHPISGVAGEVIDKVLRRDLPSTGTQLFERDSIEGDEPPRRHLQQLNEREWDGDFDLEERSSDDDSNLLGHSYSGYKEETRKSHGFESKRPLFRKDP